MVKVSLSAEGLMGAEGPNIVLVKTAKLLQLAGLAASAGEGSRKLKENAVSVNGTKFSEAMISRAVLGESPALRLGKKSVRVEWVD